MQELGEQVWTSRAAAARLPLCEAVIAETTRLMLGDGRYGVSLISLMRRVARKDFECAGFRIKHGEAVLFAMPPMMQAMSSFAAPDGGFDRRFDPHRFIKVRTPCLHASTARIAVFVCSEHGIRPRL